MMQITAATADNLQRPEARNLLALAMYRPDRDRITEVINLVAAQRALAFAARSGDRIAGVLIVERTAADAFSIRHIAVSPDHQRKGAGRLLVNHLLKVYPDSKLGAETDAEAVDFYHSLGFRIEPLGEKYPGTLRYRCLYDHGYWAPTPFSAVVHIIQSAGYPCWVAGGWALDLFHGRQTRDHADTDVLILRQDQLHIKRLFKDWEMFHTHAPGLRYWRHDEYLPNIPNVWVRENARSAWAFEIMFQDCEDGEWVYRRNRQIRGPLCDMGLVNSEGIPYLRPEIQLLYKGGSSSPRPKDFTDMKRILPLMSQESKEWLLAALKTQFPAGHAWISYITQTAPSPKE